MIDLIVELEKDIKRCEETLQLNNLLETAIIIEEVIDKYKNKIDDVPKGKDRVWDYKKEDMINLIEILENHKSKLSDDILNKLLKEKSISYLLNKIEEKINENNDIEISDKKEIEKDIANIKKYI